MPSLLGLLCVWAKNADKYIATSCPTVVARVCEARALTALMMTLDAEFAAIAAHRVLTLEPSTGRLAPQKARRRWF